MKRYIYAAALCSLLYTLENYSVTKPTARPITSNHLQTQTNPHFQTSISPLELNTNGSYIITTPGEHYLTKDIDFAPGNDDDIMIHIKTSNVSLNLNGKQIKQGSTHTTSNFRGIVVDEGLSNVVIHNGSIHDCSGAGIVVKENCSNISLFKLSIFNCNLGGIIIGYDPFDTGTYASVHMAQEKSRFVNPAIDPVNSTQDILLESVFVSGVSGYYNTNTDVFAHAVGIHFVDVKNFQILNCISNSNQYGAPNDIKNSSTVSGGHYVASRTGYNGYGIHFVRCQNGHVQSCECSCNQGWSAAGFLLDRSEAITFENCFANHNSAEGDPVQHTNFLPATFNFVAHRDLGRAAGFLLNDSSGNNFHECSASYTQGNREVAGFWFRRYVVFASNTPLINSQLFDPTIVQDQVALSQTAANIDIGNVLLVPPTPNPIPAIGAGYNVTDGSLYLQNSGSNYNRCENCQAQHSSSTYLSAHGFLSQANTNNSFVNITGQNSTSGTGSNSYLSAGSISDFDTGVGVWSLTEHEQYKSPHTNKIIQYATGIALECSRIPLFVWNATNCSIEPAVWNTVAKMLNAPGGSGNLLFAGSKVQSSPNAYGIHCWSETCSSICNSTLQENFGSCVGAGVGILLNGAYKSLIKKNWLYCNHSCTLGSSSEICENTTGIGALGGYGLLDLAINSTTLAMENLAFANQVIKPKTVTICCDGTPLIGFGNYIEGANYHVKYTDAGLSLPVESASIGDFSPFNTLTPFSNFEWECTTLNPMYVIKDKMLIEAVARVFTL